MSLYSLAPLITSLLIFSMGSFVFSKNKSRTLNRIFFFLCVSSSVWLLSYAIAYGFKNEKMAFLGLKIGYSGVVFIPIATFHYAVEFLKVKKLRLFVLLNYLSGITYVILIWSSLSLIKGVSQFWWGYYPRAGIIHPFFLIHFLSLIGFSFTLWLYFFLFKKETLTIYEISRIKYIFVAFFIYNFASIDFLPNYGIEIYPFGFLPSSIFVIIIGYTVVRYHLMDIRLIFKRTAAYSLSAGLLMAFFVMLVYSITYYFSLFTNVDSFKISIFAALVIVLLFNPLRNRIQNLIDKLFYKKTYDYYATIQKVSHTLASKFNLKEIYSFIGDTILSTLGLRNVYLLNAAPGGNYEVVYHTPFKSSNGSGPENKSMELEGSNSLQTGVQMADSKDKGDGMRIDEGSETVKLLKPAEVLIKDEIIYSGDTLGEEKIERIISNLKPFQGEAVVPVFIDDKPALLMILGGKLSGDMYTYEDINLLKTISNQTAIAVKNALLYKEKISSERLASIGMVSATFAHEVRNPLTSLKTFVQLMPEKYQDVEFRDTFSKIVLNDIKRIDGLLKDLLDFSSKKKYSGIDNFDLTALINETIDYVQDKLGLEKKNIHIEKKYEDIQFNMIGDPVKLKHTFTNIINNGCQAMGEKGVLKVSIYPNGENVDIAISDTGEGMSHEEIANIFDPFYTTKSLGIGLGLAISKSIIESHGGSIKVDSKLSEGTTFTVSLPVENKNS